MHARGVYVTPSVCVRAPRAGIHVRFEKDAATGASHALALPELDAYLTMEDVAPLQDGD